MPAFPLITFHPPPGSSSVVLVITPHGNDCRHFGSIVAGKQYQGIFQHTRLFQCLDELSNDGIHLMNEISMRSGLSFSLKCLGCKRRQVHGLHRMKEKEGFFWVLLCVVLDECLTFGQKHLVDLLQVKVIGDHSGSIIARVGVLRKGGTVQQSCGRGGHSVSINVGVQPIGRGAACCTKKDIKSPMNRAIWNGSCVIDLLNRLQSVLVDRSSL